MVCQTHFKDITRSDTYYVPTIDIDNWITIFNVADWMLNWDTCTPSDILSMKMYIDNEWNFVEANASFIKIQRDMTDASLDGVLLFNTRFRLGYTSFIAILDIRGILTTQNDFKF